MPVVKSTVYETTIAEGRTLADQYPICTTYARTGECGALSPRKAGRQYTCTREPNHAGPHCAHIPGPSVIATWKVAP